LFPTKNIPEPTYYYAYLWKQGCHYWKKNKDSEKLSKEMLNPLENIYICGESFSQQQAWMEGALQTSKEVVELINSRN
jgi:monoamine oxidase